MKILLVLRLAIAFGLAAAMLILGPSPAPAEVLIADDFESYAASTVVDPDPSGDFDPAGWSVSEQLLSDVQVASYYGAGGPPVPAPNGGSKYLRLTRPAGGYNVYANGGNGANPFYVTFDAYLKQPANYGDLYVRINGSTEQLAVGIAGAQNQFNYLAGSTWTAIPGAFATFNTWKNVRIQVKKFNDGLGNNGSYDLYYDHALVANGIPYTATTGGQFEFAFGLANGDKYYVDNFEVGALPPPTTFEEKVLALNPVAYWQFEGNYNDSSGHGNTLIPFGNVGISSTGGVPGLGKSAQGFGGENGYYVETPASSSLNFGGNEFSINLWFKSTVPAAQTLSSSIMVNKRNSADWVAGGWDYGLWTNDYGAPGDALRGTVASQMIFDSEPHPAVNELNVWHMATVTWVKNNSPTGSDGAARLYIDGELVGAGLGVGSGLAQAAHRLIIGNAASPGDDFQNTNYFKGKLDEVAVFSTALSSAEIANLYGIPVVPTQGLSRGHQILLERGLQIQAAAHSQAWGYFDANRWADSNFTTYNSDGYALDPSLMPAAPGIPWSRIATDGSFNIASAEVPYESSLVSYQLDDEPDITDPAALAYQAAATEWFRIKHPDVMTFTSNYGPRYTPAQWQNYMRQVQPDMLLSSIYPFYGQSDGASGVNFLCEDLQKFRLLGLAGNDGTGTQPIPHGVWLQTYWRESPIDPSGYHAVSGSEIRANQFVAWAFGAKFVDAYVYDNEGASIDSVLFSGDGTNSPTPQFYQIAETNRQSRNLGPALVRLISTDVRMKLGRTEVNNPSPPVAGVSNWSPGTDPYITNITVTNQGTRNSGLPGDVIIGYFKPLDPSFTNPGHENDIYFMIVNGLTNPSGVAADTRQLIRLDFNFGASGITNLLRLSRETGLVEEVDLVHTSGSLYYLNLFLDGGTGDLFKFNNGGTFVVPGVPGDFNGDGTVNAADYVWWRKLDGTPAGYALWRANFGQTSAPVQASASGEVTDTVPEPSAFVLLFISAAGMSRLVWRARGAQSRREFKRL